MRRTNLFREKITSVNAFTKKSVGVPLEVDTAENVAAKFRAAQKAQPAWAAAGFKHRAECIKRFQGLLAANVDNLAQTLSEEMGKPVNHAKGEIKNTGPRIQFFLDNTERVIAEQHVAPLSSGTEDRIRFEPIGVVGNISAWNFPYFVGSNVWIPALLTGNAVLYKPSEWTLQTGRRVAELMLEAGIPKEIFTPVYGSGATGAALVDQPLDGIFFTGSSATGRKIASSVFSEQAIAKRAREAPRAMFPRLGLELGGKDPVYVCDDVKDPVGAGEGLADGAMYNGGQSCCSVERIYAHASVYDKVVEGAVKAAKSFAMGDPANGATYLGPLTMPSQPAFLQAQVDEAVAKGAKVLVGGTRKGAPSDRFYPPTVLVNVDNSMAIMREESFGPVIGIMKVNSDDEAIKLMNDTAYGLTAGVFSANQKRAEGILAQVNAGTGYINCCDRVSACSPWSGRGASGLGSTLSTLGIQAFVQPKAYHIRP